MSVSSEGELVLIDPGALTLDPGYSVKPRASQSTH
jgi:hypothetical protein